jgi:hypothetical protein
MNKRELHNLDQLGKLKSLERALIEGINSGEAVRMTKQDWLNISVRAKALHAANYTKREQERGARTMQQKVGLSTRLP